EGPFPLRRLGRRFEPSLRCEDVVAAVAVYVTSADAVSVAVLAHDVLDPRAALQIEPDERGRRAIELGQQLARLAVVVEIDQLREFGGEAFVDFAGRPRPA